MHRDPPHYLKPLATTTTPKRLLWLACDGRIIQRGGQYEMRFHGASLGRTWYSGMYNARRDTVDTFANAAELWNNVADWCTVGRRVVLFAYDLAREMRLSEMLIHLPALGYSLDKIVLEKTAAWCKLSNGKRSLLCCDLASWVTAPWSKIVQDTQAWRTDLGEGDSGALDKWALLRFRAHVIRDAMLQIFDFVEGENCGPFRPTGSGQSYACFRRRFIRSRLLVHDDFSRLSDERASMYTGRAEAWRHGMQRNGSYTEYDMHAAYAEIGCKYEVPTVARGYRRNPTTALLERDMQRFAVLADCEVTTEVPCLPASVGGRTLWPVGSFRTLLWCPELRLALDTAQSVKCRRAWLYDRGPAIHDFCKYVLEGMEAQTTIYGPVTQRMLKHWSRCMIGRLGLRYRAWHKFGPQEPPDVRLVSYADWETGERTDLLLAGSQALLLGDMEESTESLPQVPAWIMSKCRALLWQAICTAGSRLVYVDTDSVIVQTGPYDGGDDVRLELFTGMRWDTKGVYGRMNIRGPRNLDVDHARRVSGVPLTATQTRPLEYSGQVMSSVKSSMRDGRLDAVVSMPRMFHMVTPDLRRIHNPDGSTSPYRLELPCS